MGSVREGCCHTSGSVFLSHSESAEEYEAAPCSRKLCLDRLAGPPAGRLVLSQFHEVLFSRGHLGCRSSRRPQGEKGLMKFILML